MLTSSALVLMMTAPGLALFYSGLVRKKNVLGVMMQCVFFMGLMTVIWALYGYTLSFGGGADNPFVGNGEFLFMNNVQMVDGVGSYGRFHTSAHPYAFPRDVLHYHARPHRWCLCRTHEVQHDGGLHGAVGNSRLLPSMSLGVGRRDPL
jgi:hypothetical protein